MALSSSPHIQEKTRRCLEKMISLQLPHPEITGIDTHAIKSGGHCRRCGREHWLGAGNTLAHCRQLMDLFMDRGTIDLFAGRSPALPSLATDWLLGPARGKMFGILECVGQDGATTILRAFSGQYNGFWLVDGWAPPLFPVDEFMAVSAAVEPRIKVLGREIEGCAARDDKWLRLRKERRQQSQELMKELLGLYRLSNFRGETTDLGEAFYGRKNGIPTGTGDCCAPKLLNYAARHQLRPVGLAEFYWGQENPSGSRQHGTFSGSCREKCQPILGFMLCGLEE